MKKAIYLFSLVALLILTGLAEAISGFVLWFAIPSGGGRRGLELSYWGLTRPTWIDFHDWMAVALTAIVILHLLVHWKWVFRMVKQIFNILVETYRGAKKVSPVQTG